MIDRKIAYSLVAAGALLAGSAGLNFAEAAGLVGGDTARRAIQVVIGLGLAGYANFMPKDIGPAARSVRAAAATQSILRVAGWALTLAGLAYAALWAFASLAFADVASVAVIMTALIVGAAHGAWRVMVCRRASA